MNWFRELRDFFVPFLFVLRLGSANLRSWPTPRLTRFTALNATSQACVGRPLAGCGVWRPLARPRRGRKPQRTSTVHSMRARFARAPRALRARGFFSATSSTLSFSFCKRLCRFRLCRFRLCRFPFSSPPPRSKGGGRAARSRFRPPKKADVLSHGSAHSHGPIFEGVPFSF